MGFTSSLFQLADKTFVAMKTTSWHTYAITSIFALFAPLKNYVYLMITLLFVDAVTSIYYQYRQNRPSNKNIIDTIFSTIESKKLRTTFEKMVFYIIGICVVYLFEIRLLQNIPDNNVFDILSVTNISAMLICAIELYSILENIGKITNNPVWLKIANMIRKKVDEKVEVNSEP